MVLLIDNYDSFTCNLHHYALQCGMVCNIYRNDELTLGDIENINPSGFIFSPGPKTPKDHPLLFRILER